MKKLWRAYRGWPRWAQISVAALVALVVIVTATSDPEKMTSASPADTTTSAAAITTTATTPATTTAPVARSSSRCERAGKIVEGYNILARGASREGYLTLLHKLQRDCPTVASKLGLTGDLLPQCERLEQENCTMYSRP